jgi:hypothetical protein
MEDRSAHALTLLHERTAAARAPSVLNDAQDIVELLRTSFFEREQLWSVRRVVWMNDRLTERGSRMKILVVPVANEAVGIFM